MFKKAVKYESKGRVALVGPAGSGKSWTGLTLARALVGAKGKIAAIDTEHGSLSKYADKFDFDVLELDSFHPDNFMKALKAAEAAGYDAFVCDSLSHFWTGKDGALEFVDLASKRHKDGMGGWKEFRPHERAMVDAMIASPMHVVVTMRTKTEYQEQINAQTGKKQRVKIGLQPVQREGLEYEFDLVGYMDDENTLIVDKTRCSDYTGKMIAKPQAKDFATFVAWLRGSEKPVLITAEQAAELHAAARAKEIKNEDLLKHLGVSRLGELEASALPAALKWVELQGPSPVDAEIEALIRLDIPYDSVVAYIESLPYADDRASVAKHLAKLRAELKLEGLRETFKKYATKETAA